MRTSLIGRVTLSVVLLLVGGLLVAACGASTSSDGCGLRGAIATSNAAASTTIAASGSWPYPNADLANTRDASDSTISSANVSRLAQAWTFKLTGKAATGVRPYGSLAANPIVQNGVVYLQDLDSNVYALALATGKLEWEYRCNQPERSGPGPNGVAVADGTVYGLTPTAAFALNATTGRTIWVNSNLLSKGQGTFGIQPQVANGRVYLASQYGSGPGGGVLLALNASSGAVLWRFNTVVGPEPGVQALGARRRRRVGDAARQRRRVGDLRDRQPISNPGRGDRASGRELYTDSDVNLDAATGKLRWYYQGVPNDFKDYDMQTSPISASVNGVPVVIGSGKMGYVYEMNAETGKLIWKTPVGEHNGHDNDSLQALEHASTLKAPFTILPGSLGGVLTNLAVAGDSVYVVTFDLPLTYTNLNRADPDQGRRVLHRRGGGSQPRHREGRMGYEGAQLPLGAATVSNDLVFTTLYDGVLIALNRRTGAIVYRHRLPTSTNAPIAIAGNTVIVPAGGSATSAGGGHPQVVAYKCHRHPRRGGAVSTSPPTDDNYYIAAAGTPGSGVREGSS